MKEEDRQRLRSAYPSARVHTFHGTDHASSILDPQGYIDAIRHFLAQVPPPSAAVPQ